MSYFSHSSLLLRSADFRGAEFFQYVFGVFSEPGWMLILRRSPFEPHRVCDHSQRAELRMLYGDHSFAVQHLRMVESLRDREQGAAGNVVAVEDLQPLGGVFLHCHAFDAGHQLRAVFVAGLVDGVALILPPVGLAEGGAEARPDPVVGDGHGDRSVTAFQHLVRNDAGMDGAVGYGVLLRGERRGGQVGHGGEKGFQQRDLNMVSLAGGLPFEQRGEDSLAGELSSENVGYGETGLDGVGDTTGTGAVGQQDAGHGLNNEVVAWPRTIWSGKSETGNRGKYEPWIGGFERCVADAQLFHDAWAEVLHQHVRGIGQVVQGGEPRLLFKIEQDTFLVAV